MTLQEYKNKLKEISDETGVDFGNDCIRVVLNNEKRFEYSNWIYFLKPDEDLKKVNKYNKEKLREVLTDNYFVYSVCYDVDNKTEKFNDFQVVFKTKSGIIKVMEAIAYIPWDVYGSDLESFTGTLLVKLK